MKRGCSIFLLVLMSGCATTNLPPAPPQSEPLEQANQIIVRTSDAPADAYRRVALILTEHAFTIAHTDDTLFLISTEYREIGAGSMRANILVSPSGEGAEIVFRGKMMLGVNVGKALVGSSYEGDPGSPIENRGMSGSLAQKAFAELEAIAKAYPDGEVLYSRN